MKIVDPKKLFLAQTDTTVGFLSQDSKRLANIKKRDFKKPFLISVDSFETLKKFVRVPKKYKKFVRRSQKTTFVYPKGLALRVVKDKSHLKFLKKFRWLYSTSANFSGKKFNLDFAFKVADIVVKDERGFFEGKPSKIVKLGKANKKRLR